MKAKAIDAAKTKELASLVDEKKNLVSNKNVHLGFAAETQLEKLLTSKKITEKDVENLRAETMLFIKSCLTKLGERCPLMSTIVRNCEALSPTIIATNSQDSAKKKMKNLIKKIFSLNIIDCKDGDAALTEFTRFLTSEAFVEKKKFIDFNRNEKRLDEFYFDVMRIHDNYPSFSLIVKLLCTISHGQASVERGFNDNHVVLKDNISAETVIARRFLKNYMRVNAVQPYDLQVSRDLLNSVHASRQRYNQNLEDKRKEAKKSQKQSQLMEVENELRIINRECSSIKETISSFNAEIFKKLKSAAETPSNELRCKMIVVERNALKRKSEEKEEQLQVLKKRAKELDEKKKSFNV